MRVYSLSLWLRVAFRFRRAFLRRKREDVSGELRDLMMLSHSVEESWAAMEAAGLAPLLT